MWKEMFWFFFFFFFCSSVVFRAFIEIMSTVQKILTQPINLIFRFLQNRTRVCIWLYENNTTRITGEILGFDEYMNLVLDNACEVNLKTKEETK